MLEVPVLDNKRYRQILAEAVARIPTLTDDWTDFNPQDTGMMLLELMSAMTEMQIFYLDQVGDRFYDQYLALVTDPVEGETTMQRTRRFALQSAQPDVAVTPGDYERIAMALPLPLSKVKAEYADGFLRLTVLGKSPPLSDSELDELRKRLEPYRLLTTRLQIRQASFLSVTISCRVVLDFSLARAGDCTEKIERLFRRMVEEKDAETVLNLGHVRSELLSIPEVTQIDELSVLVDGEEQNQAFSQKNVFLSIGSIKVEISNKRGAG